MDLKALRYLLTIADEGSISAAAERLGVSQPNLSRQMSVLEGELGVKLLVRGSRRTELTEEGAILRRRASEMLELAEMAREEISASDVRGTVRISAGETDAMRMIARVAKDFSKEHPDVMFQFHSGNAGDVTDRLDRGLSDFGVLIEPADKSRYDFVSIPATIGWGLMVTEDDPVATKGFAEPSDLVGRRLIVSQQRAAVNGISGWFGGDWSRLDMVASYNLLYNASLLVSEGMGSALCLEGIVGTDGNGLRFVPLEPELRVGMSLVWKKGGVQGKAQRLFLDALRRGFASEEA